MDSLPLSYVGSPFTPSRCPQVAFLILSHGTRLVSITTAMYLLQGLAFYRRSLPPLLEVSLEQTGWQVQMNMESLQLTCTPLRRALFIPKSFLMPEVHDNMLKTCDYLLHKSIIYYVCKYNEFGRESSLKAQLNDLKRCNNGNNICFKLGVGDTRGN